MFLYIEGFLLHEAAFRKPSRGSARSCRNMDGDWPGPLEVKAGSEIVA